MVYDSKIIWHQIRRKLRIVEYHKKYFILYTLLLVIYLYLLSYLIVKISRGVLNPKRLGVVVYGRGPTAYLTASVLAANNYHVCLMSPSKDIITKFYYDPNIVVEIPHSYKFYADDYTLTYPSDDEILFISSLTGLNQEIVKAEADKLFSTGERLNIPSDVSLVTKIRESLDNLNEVHSYQVPVFWRNFPENMTISCTIETLEELSDEICINGEFYCHKFINCDEYPIDLGSYKNPSELFGIPMQCQVGTTLKIKSKDKDTDNSQLTLYSIGDDSANKINITQEGKHLQLDVSSIQECITLDPSGLRFNIEKDELIDDITNKVFDNKICSLSVISNWSWGPLFTGLLELSQKDSKIYNIGPLALKTSWDPLRDGFILSILSSYIIS